MTNVNKEMFDTIGLTPWHEAGYTGKHGLSATGEGFVKETYTVDWWSDPLGKGEGAEHALSTAMVFHQFAPDRKLVSLLTADNYLDERNDFRDKVIPYMVENQVDSLFLSMETILYGTDELLNEVPYCTFLTANGNHAEESYNKAAEGKNIYGVGAYWMNQDKPAFYTSVSEYVDFCAPTNVQVPFQNGKGSYPFTGTSCAAPALAGMCACINDFFIEKTGKPLKREAMYQFLKDCCRDVGKKGKDTQCGWGLPILPKPEDVEVAKYAEERETEEQMVYKDTKGHWAEESIDIVSEMGLMTGFPDGTFRPDQSITRAQMAEILVRAIINDDI